MWTQFCLVVFTLAGYTFSRGDVSTVTQADEITDQGYVYATQVVQISDSDYFTVNFHLDSIHVKYESSDLEVTDNNSNGNSNGNQDNSNRNSNGNGNGNDGLNDDKDEEEEDNTEPETEPVTNLVKTVRFERYQVDEELNEHLEIITNLEPFVTEAIFQNFVLDLTYIIKFYTVSNDLVINVGEHEFIWGEAHRNHLVDRLQ